MHMICVISCKKQNKTKNTSGSCSLSGAWFMCDFDQHFMSHIILARPFKTNASNMKNVAVGLILINEFICISWPLF